MEITVNKSGEIIIITVNTPNATVQNAPQLNSVLSQSIEENNHNIVVDMSCVKYIDSTYLGQLLKYLKLSQRAGGDLKLVACEGCGDHPIWLMFEITGTSEIFSIYNSAKDAIESFGDLISSNN